MESEIAPPASPEIIARPANYYRFTRFVMVAALLVYGGLSIRDGFFKWPPENDAAKQRGLVDLPHPGLDIPFNQVLGVALPPVAALLLAWTLFNSRGSYRLDGETLRIPGHPPLPLDSLRTIDRSKWDRKGIARITYELPAAGKTATFKLDDFVYERPPTDAIFKKIETHFREPPVGELPETNTPDSPTRI